MQPAMSAAARCCWPVSLPRLQSWQCGPVIPSRWALGTWRSMSRGDRWLSGLALEWPPMAATGHIDEHHTRNVTPIVLRARNRIWVRAGDCRSAGRWTPTTRPLASASRYRVWAVLRAVRQATANLLGDFAFRENGNAVMRSLPMPYGPVARCFDGRGGEFGVVGLHLLQANDVGTCLREPLE
jgi:hypothetical protein